MREALPSTTGSRQRMSATTAAFYDLVDEGAAFRLSSSPTWPTTRKCADGWTSVMAQAAPGGPAGSSAKDARVPDAASWFLSVALVGVARLSAQYSGWTRAE